jgi:hypothetical protein
VTVRRRIGTVLTRGIQILLAYAIGVPLVLARRIARRVKGSAPAGSGRP